jgi:hypothetical protein
LAVPGQKKRLFFVHAPFAIQPVFTDILDVTIWVRAAVQNGGEAVRIRPALYLNGALVRFGSGEGLVDATSYAWFSHTIPTTNPSTGQPFTREDLNAAEVGVEVEFLSGVSTVKVSTIYMDVTSRCPTPRDWGTTKVWVVGPYAHPQSPVPAPAPGVRPFHVGQNLSGITYGTLPASGTGNRYYFVARLTDTTGRHSALIVGSDGVEVP